MYFLTHFAILCATCLCAVLGLTELLDRPKKLEWIPYLAIGFVLSVYFKWFIHNVG